MPVTAENDPFELVSSLPDEMQLLKVHPTRPILESVHFIPGPTLLGTEKVVFERATSDPDSTSMPATVAPPPVTVPLVLTASCDPPVTLMWDVPADMLEESVDMSHLLPLLTSNAPPELDIVSVPSTVMDEAVRLITGAPIVPRTVLVTLILVVTASVELINTI